MDERICERDFKSGVKGRESDRWCEGGESGDCDQVICAG